MISFETAKSGHTVIRKNGRLLDSSIDPIREAASYFNRMIPPAGDAEQAVVLGLGSGYQILEILKQKKYKSILVIENDCELVDQVRSLHSDLNSPPLKFCVETDWTKLSANLDFRDAIASVYSIFFHGPSLQIEPDFYRSVESLLRGRDKLSFLHLLKTKPDLLAHFKPGAIESFGSQPLDFKSAEEPVGIRQICELFHENSRMSRERRVWRVLEELLA